ncbi:hypothetical protein FQN52_003853 [Onygenales sp. PD_12]|nr:hypothetical protein FQN52_003853 [Onygenales sp. PD_12]
MASNPQTFCSITTSMVVSRLFGSPTDENQKLDAITDMVLFRNIPGVITQEELPARVAIRNCDKLPYGEDTFFQCEGVLLIDYDSAGSPSFFINTTQCRPQLEPGLPGSPKYIDACLGLANPILVGGGTITAHPVTQGEDCIFTVGIHTYHERRAGQNVFCDFSLHCVFPGSPRWTNTCLPHIGSLVLFSGEVASLYEHMGKKSPCVIITQFTYLPTLAPSAPAVAAASDGGQTPSTPSGHARFHKTRGFNTPNKAPRLAYESSPGGVSHAPAGTAASTDVESLTTIDEGADIGSVDGEVVGGDSSAHKQPCQSRKVLSGKVPVSGSSKARKRVHPSSSLSSVASSSDDPGTESSSEASSDSDSSSN